MPSTEPALTPEYLAEDQSGKLITVMWVVTGIPLLFIFARVYSRTVASRGRFGWDDIIAIAAECCLIGYASCTTAAAKRGLGRHVEAVAADNPENLIFVGLMAQVDQVLAVMACTLGKTAFAVTLLRILTQRWIIYTIWFIIITMNLVNVLTCFFVFLQCKKPEHLWNPAVSSKCWPTHVFTDYSLFVGSYSGAQDFVLALIPWFVLPKLQMRKKEKFGIAFAMSLGVFAGATAIVKVTYLVNLSKRTDFTWALPPLFMWAAAEDGLAIVAGSIPTLRPLLKQVFPGSTASGSNGEYALKHRSHSPGGMFVPKGQSHVQNRIYTGASTDDKSDTSILDKTDAPWSGPHIRKTTEVSVMPDRGF